jgi:hypothetical protein
MTQAYNLSQLANNLNSSGQLDATDGLVNAVPATNGGTGQAGYAVGDLLYASTTTVLNRLADVAVGNALISGGVGVAPAYGKIALTTHVSGTLPVSNGGTGAATLAANNVLLGNGTSALQAVAPSTNGNVLTSNGTTWISAPASTAVSSVNGVTGAVVTTTLGNIGSVVIAANTSTSYYLPGSTIAGSSLVYTSTFVSASGATGVVSNGTVGGSDYTYNTINSSTIRVTTSNVGYQSPLGMTALSGTWRALAFIGARSVSWDGTNNTSYSPMGLWVRVS